MLLYLTTSLIRIKKRANPIFRAVKTDSESLFFFFFFGGGGEGGGANTSLGAKKGRLAFSESQQQLVNSANETLSPKIAAKVGHTSGDFIRRSPRSTKIARCAPCSHRRKNRRYLARQISAIKFAKCARSRDFLRSSLQIANQSG